jgi:hypothetical protein
VLQLQGAKHRQEVPGREVLQTGGRRRMEGIRRFRSFH